MKKQWSINRITLISCLKLHFTYSEESYELLSLNHYLQSAYFKTEDVVLNNIGVSFQKLDFKYHSTKYYKEANELGNTLASSNLAFVYMGAGFYEEADNILKMALVQADPHQNVWKAKEQMESQWKSEIDKIEKLKASHFEQVNYVRIFASKLFNEDKTQLRTDNWLTAEGIYVEVVLDKEFASITWKEGGNIHKIGQFFFNGRSAGFCQYLVKKDSAYSISETLYTQGMYQFYSDVELRFLFYKEDEFKFLNLKRSV